MRIFSILVLLIFFSCSTDKKNFVKEDVCTNESLKYLKNPRNRYKQAINNPKLVKDMVDTADRMQGCYDEFYVRSDEEEFNTCLVAGVDHTGKLEFYNFGSKEVELDSEFLKCARSVTGNFPYSDYGRNYIVIQAYQFYVGEN